MLPSFFSESLKMIPGQCLSLGLWSERALRVSVRLVLKTLELPVCEANRALIDRI